MQKILTSLALSAALVVGVQATANAQMKVSKPSTQTQTVYSSETTTGNNLLGIGYKLGNGIGFAGADLIVNPLANVSLDLQVATMDGVIGFAPNLVVSACATPAESTAVPAVARKVRPVLIGE